MSKARGKVEKILSLDPETRSDDKKLILAYWRSEGFWLTKEQESIFLNNVTNPETIRRNRAYLQNTKGLYRPPNTSERFWASERVKNNLREGRLPFND